MLWWLAAAVLAVAGFGGPQALRSAAAGDALQVTGDVHDLRAGVPSELVLVVHNRGSEPARVVGLTARVVGGGGACPPELLHVTPWAGVLDVPAGGSASRSLPVLFDGGPGCDGVTWRLAYAATASPA